MSARPPIPPGNTAAIVQSGHGFSPGQVLRWNGSTHVLAKGDTAANAEAVGIVSHVWDANRFTLMFFGKCTELSGLTPGAVYFLSPSTAGALTTTEPSVNPQISKPLLIAITPTTGYFFDWRGMTVPAPITAMILTELGIGTDLRLVPLTGGGKLEARNPGTGLWATADQWTNP
jgi:hypothetical protein